MLIILFNIMIILEVMSMKYKILSLILAALILSSALPSYALAKSNPTQEYNLELNENLNSFHTDDLPEEPSNSNSADVISYSTATTFTSAPLYINGQFVTNIALRGTIKELVKKYGSKIVSKLKELYPAAKDAVIHVVRDLIIEKMFIESSKALINIAKDTISGVQKFTANITTLRVAPRSSDILLVMHPRYRKDGAIITPYINFQQADI